MSDDYFKIADEPLAWNSLGIYYWCVLNLGELFPGKTIRHCFWCSNVRIDGAVYDV